MKPVIRPVRQTDIEELVELTLLAFVPIFDSFQALLRPVVYPLIWPDWKKSQQKAVEDLCGDSSGKVVLVAEVDGKPVGFLAYEVRPEDDTGQVLLIAVHPDHQNHGIGTHLNEHALDEMEAAGVKLAIVETGGESSHAPARRSYEKSGYIGLPLVRYFKSLQEASDDSE
ncbi:MAG: GNAT family N-acetyltransferase [bacterium]|jgi:ribosomal protein S18 acetylase RimI-like enzyme